MFQISLNLYGSHCKRESKNYTLIVFHALPRAMRPCCLSFLSVIGAIARWRRSFEMMRFSGNTFFAICALNTVFMWWRPDSGTCGPAEQALNRVKGQLLNVTLFWHWQCQADSARLFATYPSQKRVTRMFLKMEFNFWCFNLLLLSNIWSKHMNAKLEKAIISVRIKIFILQDQRSAKSISKHEPGGGWGITPLYKVYRYSPLWRIGFLSSLV